MLRRIAPLFFWLFLLPIFCAPVHGADATSFDPTLVTVKAIGTSSIPVGTIISWPVAQNPSDWQNSDGTYNWLECNGQSISASVYPELSAVVGPQVPDLRGLFLRGYGSQSHVQNNGAIIGVTSTLHSSGALGQVQGDGNRRFTGTIGPSINAGSGGIVYGGGNAGYMVMGAAHFVTAYHYIDSARVLPTAPENRPVNQAVRYLVRARP